MTDTTSFEIYKKSDNHILVCKAPTIESIKKLLQKYWYQEDINLITIDIDGNVLNNDKNTNLSIQKIIKKGNVYGFIALHKQSQ